MQNDTLLALLLDPFLTFEEAAKEIGAITSPARGAKANPANTTAPSRLPAVALRPARTKAPGVPIIHHPPAAG